MHRRIKAAILSAGVLIAVTGIGLAEPGCPGREIAWIGAEVLRCSGGACGFSRWQASSPSGLSGGTEGITFDFTTEPELLAIRADGPGAGKLQEGDFLVAVNGYLITSPRGSREMARLEAGRTAELTVRRGDRLLEVDLKPELRCGPPVVATGEEASPVLAGTEETAATSSVSVSLPAMGVGTSAASGETSISISMPATGVGVSGDEPGSGYLGLGFECNECSFTSTSSRKKGGGRYSLTIQAREIFSKRQSLNVTGVKEGGPAWKSGLRPGDRLKSLNGIRMNRPEALDLLMDARVGDRLEIEYERDGETRHATLIAEESLPGKRREAGSSGRSRTIVSGTSWGVGDMGLLLEFCDGCNWAMEPDGSIAWNMDRPLAVVHVEPGGPADEAGLREGDVVIDVNEQSITSRKAGQLLLDARPGDWLELRYRRNGRVRSTTLKLPRD